MTDQWWTDTMAVALLGTGRRPVPPLPDELGVAVRREADAEELLLDAAALGGMLVRAGRTATAPEDAPGGAAPADAEPAAEPDAWPPAPDRAVHLLQLILGQPPFGAQLATTALQRWLTVAVERERRVPHTELPRLLTAASKSAGLRSLVAGVADARGRWLATANPAWEWLLTAGAADQQAVADGAAEVPSAADWALIPTAERVALLGRVRLTDPAAGRALLESTWASESGRDRPVLLATLADGLGPQDEELLERALDDRAAGVRTGAQKLLDRMPDSDRARRMEERLRPLVRMTGMLRRTLEIELPTAPDPAGVRDGLGKQPAGRSERGFWLEQIVAGAPLEVWTDVTGRVPAEAWRMVTSASPEAAAGIRRAATARRDLAWLRAMAAEGSDPGLLAYLPPEDAGELAVAQVPRMPAYALTQVLGGLPRPWSPELAAVVLGRIGAEKEPAWLLDALLPVLADGLTADAVPRLQRWARADDAPRALGHLVQYLSFVPAIPEAFG